MNAVQAVYLAVSMLAGIVLAGFRSDAGHSRGSLAWGLATLVVALLCVGIVSHTFARHVVQVIPPVVALVIVLRGSNLGPAAAAPIFTFWLGVMANIWMFLLGIARIFTGTFTLIEIALTLVIGIACGFGIVAILRSSGRTLPAGKRVATAITFGTAQLAALVASFQPMFR